MARATAGLTGKELRDADIARRNWARYAYGKLRGHTEWCEHALKLEGMYLGGGRQWDDEDREVLEGEGRKPFELNEIFDAINSALGHQIQNRVDFSYRPRTAGANDKTAETLSKVAMQIADNNDYRHKELQVTSDGFIQQRGYFELTVGYDDSLTGEIKIEALDPLDVIPDPDAKDYDPDTWRDVIVTRWLSLDEIEIMYGRKAREKVESRMEGESDDDFGDSEIDGVRRNKFGHETELYPDYEGDDESDVTMVRIVDRQHWEIAPTEVVLYPTGDIRIMEDATEAQRQAALRAGGMMFRRPMRRVRWTVSTYGEVLLHDGWSPYRHFTVVPFFPFFRRGITRGLVDNAIGAQEMLNKALSQYIHILNSVANSGWLVEQNSLTNMSTEDLEEQGAATGLIIEYKKGSAAPEKIKPNEVPTGVDRLIELGSNKIRTITGITDAFRGQAQSGSQSGRAIQSLQFGSQLSLAAPLDNLSRTRHLLASRMLTLIQSFMDVPQVMRIVATDPATGKEHTEELQLNWYDEAIGEVINNLTIGEYDAVVSEQPSQITFEHSQYEMALAMKKEGAPIPWSYVVRYSPLSERNELARNMSEAEQGERDIEAEAKAALAEAQAAAVQVKGVKDAMEALFSAMRASQLLRSDPALAGLSDQMLASGGFIDRNAPPIVPDASGLPPAAPPPTSTNPLTPDNPQSGATAGLETAPV